MESITIFTQDKKMPQVMNKKAVSGYVVSRPNRWYHRPHVRRIISIWLARSCHTLLPTYRLVHTLFPTYLYLEWCLWNIQWLVLFTLDWPKMRDKLVYGKSLWESNPIRGPDSCQTRPDNSYQSELTTSPLRLPMSFEVNLNFSVSLFLCLS